MRFAVSRTPSANGRINRLIVSMIIRMGISGVGVPSGRGWPSVIVGCFRRPINTVASQRGTARPKFTESWVVGVKVYGIRPSMLREIRNRSKEVRIRAHLCPSDFMGINRWCVNWLINQA